MTVQISNAADRKDAAGKWLRSFREQGVRYHTRGGKLWNSLSTRTKQSGRVLKNYVDVSNRFKDFQEFMDWATAQYGYSKVEPCGSPWSLDKDILVYGNRIYAPDFCIFVPQHINKLVLENPKYRGDFAIGVSLAASGRYRARVKDGGREVHLGVFDTEQQAHSAWVQGKRKIVARILSSPEVQEHERLKEALTGYIERLEEIL